MFNNKEHLCSIEGLQNCYAHALVHSPMSTFLRAHQCFVRHLRQCIQQGLQSLAFCMFIFEPAPVHALS